MELRDTRATTAAESEVSFEGLSVFPFDNPSAEEKIIIMKNVSLSNDFIKFDLDLSELREKDIRNSQLKIVLGTSNVLNQLEKQEFPEILTNTSRTILLSDASRKNIYKAKKEIKNVRLDFGEAELIESPIKIFVTLVISSKVGIVNFFSINKNDILFIGRPGRVEPTTELLPMAGQDISPVLTTATSILSRDTYVSDLHYSYSVNNVFSGFYSMDGAKFINKYAKFPHLLDPNDDQSFSNFLLRTEVYLLKYEKQNYGYHFDDVLGPVISTRVDNIVVGNSSGKMFCNFIFSGVSSLAEYQAKLVFSFQDITINLMKGLIDGLKDALTNEDRPSARLLINEAYGNKITAEYREGLEQINIMSIAAFHDFMNKVLSDLQRRVAYSQEKSVSNQHVQSQYMFPSPNIPNLAISTFEKKFLKVISLKQQKQNSLMPFTRKDFFNEAFSRSALSSIDVSEVLETTSKSFLKTSKLEPIKEFLATSIVDKTTATSNLETNLKSGRSDDRREEKLSVIEPEKFITLTSVVNRQVKFLYLDRVGESVSALIFREADPDFLSSITNNTKVLVKLDTPEEFFDSYFYVVGNNFEA
tara:strand:+ start:23389 stop:25149 length:1761 start_codon:yes stop_codon:yes gene_type:complete